MLTRSDAGGHAAPPPPAAAPPPLEVEELEVVRPDGKRLFRASLRVEPGRVVALMGPSGSGKTTLLRALIDRRALEEAGFAVSARHLAVHGDVAVVPQGGAAFDHLSAGDNVALVLRNRRPRVSAGREAVAQWLERVGLPRSFASTPTPVTTLSGGMTQRLCLARALAAGRRLLILDEPSTGLDLARVEELAAELRKQARESGVAVLLVTHDSALVSQAADEVYFVGVSESGFDRIELPAVGAVDADARRALVEGELRAKEAPVGVPVRRRSRQEASRLRWLGSLLGGLRQPLLSALGILESLRAPLADRLEVLRHSYVVALLAPAAFYLVVSTLLGYTILYVISSSAPHGIASATAVEIIGGSYVVALTPPLASLLFVACSGATVNAWLGTMGLTGQVEALRSLGIAPRRYLWGPVWETLALSYLAVCVIFGCGLLAGGLLLCHAVGVEGAFHVLTEDLFYPRPERIAMRTRALYLVFIYAVGTASEVVWRASRTMRESREVPRAMTTSVILVTLWVVVWELVTAMWLFDAPGPA